MKIAIIVNSLENKGPVIVAVNLAEQLKFAGMDVSIFYFKEKNEKIKTNVPIRKISFGDFFSLQKYDIVHSHSLLPDLFNSLQTIFNKNLSVTTVHNNIYTDLYPEYSKLKSFLLKVLWELSWCLIRKKVCISKSLLEQYTSLININQKQWSYVYNSVDKLGNDFLSQNDKIALQKIKNLKEHGKIIVGSCAVITQRKGLQYLVSAAEHFDDKYIIVIVGDGPFKKELININTKNVIFLEKTMAPRVFMRNFDIYVMPSISEGFGLAAVEAAIEGCKLVCSNIPTFIELFEDNCSYFDINNPDSLVEAIELVNLIPEKRLNRFALEKFNGKNMLKSYLEIYDFDAHKNKHL